MPEKTEDFTADPVELFFDLVFVFAFSQLVWHLVHEPTLGGVLRFALLFFWIWMSWAQFTWLANAVSGNGRVVRALFLLSTIASVPMAASVTTAFGSGGAWFGWSIAAIGVLGMATFILGLPPGSGERQAMVRLGSPTLVALVLLVAGGHLDETPRIILWCISISLFVVGTIIAGHNDWIVRSGHFAERHGLIMIVALGEVIVATGLPVVEALSEGEGLPGETVTAMVAAATFACLIWWSYFDRPVPALEHHSEQLEGRGRSRFARDVYTYAHAPLIGGVILAAAALEEIALHPSDDVPGAFQWMLWGGLACIQAAMLLAAWRAWRVYATERLITLALVGVVILLGFNGVITVILVDIVILVMLVVEHIRIESHAEEDPAPAVSTA